MTIELNQEQELALQRLIEAGRYDTPQDFIDEALADAYSYTEAFAEIAREKLAVSREDVEAGRVVTIPQGKLGEMLDRHRSGTLEPRR